MKNSIVLLSFMLCFVSLLQGQIATRVMVSGKVSADIGSDIEGIVVYNRSTDQGTITNSKGEFLIRVGLNDRIEIVAMQYQHFTVLIDSGVIESGRLTIFLKETVNQLEEVIVRPHDLLGNVSVDVAKVRIGEQKGIEEIANQTSNIINDVAYDFRPDALTKIENKGVKEKGMINGLNFVNLFKFIYANEILDKKESKDVDFDEKVRELYDDQFFKDYLALEYNQIGDFIAFAAANGLSTTYFESGKELDLIQFLIYKRKQFSVGK